MNFSTDDILRALREGATDADLATEFAKSLNEATKLHEEENAKAKVAEAAAAAAAKETLYQTCADAFTAVLKAEGIDNPVTVEDIHAIVDGVKRAGAVLEKLMDSFGDVFSTLDKEVKPKRGKRAEIAPSSDDDIIRSFLASL